ncbi:MAG: hypothetical protein QXI81_01785 [Nitrososphaerota archaeon]
MSVLRQRIGKIMTKILGAVIVFFGSTFLYWLITPGFVLSIASGLIVFMVCLFLIAGIILLFF